MNRPLGALVMIWSTLCFSGVLILADHAAKPGIGATAVPSLDASMIDASGDLPQLLVFAHPRCPCTRATLSELERIMTTCHGQVSAYVCILAPSGPPEGWANSEIERRARRIPGVTVIADTDGALAQRFGAVTSGQVVLYDPDGHVLYQGGITGGRGHVGASEGASAVISGVRVHRMARQQGPVYGCALFAHETSRTAPCPVP